MSVAVGGERARTRDDAMVSHVAAFASRAELFVDATVDVGRAFLLGSARISTKEET